MRPDSVTRVTTPRSRGLPPLRSSRSRLAGTPVSFVPVTGPATFRPAEPPREGVVEFTDERRTVALPIRAAIPVLTKARTREDLHPSVGLLSGAALLGMRLVAAGKFAPGGNPPSWRVAGLDADDEDRIAQLGRSGPDDLVLVRELLDAVADALPRAAPTAVTPPPHQPRGGDLRAAAPGPAGPAPAGRRRRPAPAGADLAAGRGRRGGAGRGRRTPGAAGPRRAEPAPPRRPGVAVDRHARRARLRRPGAHPRDDRAAGRRRRLAGARPAARAAGARRDHPRHRRAGQPARRGRGRAPRREASTCCGRAAWAAT